MTNKEAIKYLIVPTATSTKPSAEYLKQREAYDLAIKALEDGPQEDEKLYNFVSSPTDVVKVGEPIPNSDEINKALENGELYKRGFKEGYKQAIIDGKTNFSRPQGEWIDYDNTFYKCPDCGYLLEKCCPQCQNKVILPKGGTE